MASIQSWVKTSEAIRQRLAPALSKWKEAKKQLATLQKIPRFLHTTGSPEEIVAMADLVQSLQQRNEILKPFGLPELNAHFIAQNFADDMRCDRLSVEMVSSQIERHVRTAEEDIQRSDCEMENFESEIELEYAVFGDCLRAFTRRLRSPAFCRSMAQLAGYLQQLAEMDRMWTPEIERTEWWQAMVHRRLELDDVYAARKEKWRRMEEEFYVLMYQMSKMGIEMPIQQSVQEHFRTTWGDTWEVRMAKRERRAQAQRRLEVERAARGKVRQRKFTEFTLAVKASDALADK